MVIHADSEMKKEEYSIIREFAGKEKNVFLTGKRIHGELDMRSLVDIALLMIEKAVTIEQEQNIHFSYYGLMSGQDYLIKPIDEIYESLNRAYPKPFIDCRSYQKQEPVFFKFDNNQATIRLTKWASGHIHNPALWQLFRYLRYAQRVWYRVRKENSYYALRRQNIEMYMGLAWWILPDAVIAYIQSEIEKKPAYIDVILNGTYTPEETFFQIMALKSPLKDRINVRKAGTDPGDHVTWAIFTGAKQDKPFTGHPYCFCSDDFDEIRKSNYWIARKFDETTDRDIMDRIDTEILHIR